MFIGREKELEELNKLYTTDKFQMPVIYGRRRVGKSTLIREFVKNKKTVFFTAVESTIEKNLELFSKSIYASLIPEMATLPAFKDFETAFDFLSENAKDARLIVVIDEYPYLAGADKSISSRLQSYIDTKFKDGKLYLILCGSSMSFMENQVLGYQSPLYGRRTAQFKILPFDYLVSAQFVPNYTPEDKTLVYGVTGGIPKYLELFDANKSVHENIIQLFFHDSGYLYEEPSNLMKQELREAGNYNAIIETMACGANRINELVGKTHLDSATVTYCMKALLSLGIVKKECAVTEENNRKKTHYVVADQMFRFWYRFVPNSAEMVLQKNGEMYYEEVVKSQLADYMGEVFEDICRTYLLKQSNQKRMPFQMLKVGKWWGNNPVLQREEEIDVVAINTIQKKVLLGECKYRKEKVEVDVMETLQERGGLLPGNLKKYYCVCSKSGFTERAWEFAKQHSILTVQLEDIYLDESI